MLALFGVTAAALLVWWAVWWIGSPRPPETAALESRTPPASAADDRSPVRELEEIPDEGERESEAAGAVGSPAPANRFEGRGTLRGEVLAKPGLAFPERWVLRVEPHPYLAGSQGADTRRVEFQKGERAFRVENLPLAGYSIRAEAAGLNSFPAEVLLVKGSQDQFVTLMFLPSGFIDGGVQDASGAPAEGLDVTLESTATLARATVTTDAAGTFLFRDVLDGEYQLFLGPPDAPLLPPDSIAFQAPSLRFPTRTLPPTANLKITVVDTSLRPRAAVRISGSAPRGSAVDTFSNHLGEARARHLLPGRYLIDARSEDGLAASAAFDLAGGEEKELQMIVRARKSRG